MQQWHTEYMKWICLALIYLSSSVLQAQESVPQGFQSCDIPLNSKTQPLMNNKLDQSTPLSTAKSYLNILASSQSWQYISQSPLIATSPFILPAKQKAIFSRISTIRNFIPAPGLGPEAFVDESTILVKDNLAIAYIITPSKTNPYLYAATAVALVKKGEKWYVSLTPGSFENTFLPFDDTIRQNAEQLSQEGRKKIYAIANKHTLQAGSKALETISKYRNDYIKNKSDAEIKKEFIRCVKGNDPATIAAFIVKPPYLEKSITKTNRLSPIVSALRLQDKQPENISVTQPTLLSYLNHPNTIIVPLKPHSDDNLPPPTRNNVHPDRNEKSSNNVEKHSFGTFSILPPRMSMPPEYRDAAFIYRYTLTKITDPSDNQPVFGMQIQTNFRSWDVTNDTNTTQRIISEFHDYYPLLASPTVEDCLKNLGSAILNGDTLTGIRMLNPDYFQSPEKFQKGMKMLKTAYSAVSSNNYSGATKRLFPQQSRATYHFINKDNVKATLSWKFNPKAPNWTSRVNLYFINIKNKGWLLQNVDMSNFLPIH